MDQQINVSQMVPIWAKFSEDSAKDDLNKNMHFSSLALQILRDGFTKLNSLWLWFFLSAGERTADKLQTNQKHLFVSCFHLLLFLVCSVELTLKRQMSHMIFSNDLVCCRWSHFTFVSELMFSQQSAALLLKIQYNTNIQLKSIHVYLHNLKLWETLSEGVLQSNVKHIYKIRLIP